MIRTDRKEKYLRSLKRRMDPTGLFCRLGLRGEKEFAGKASEKRVLLYRKKRGMLSLFALTLRGKWVQKDGEDVLLCRFGRCLPLTVLWGIWCSLMMAAGISLYFPDVIFAADPLSATLLILLALILLALFFIPSKKEKERLLAFFTIECR